MREGLIIAIVMMATTAMAGPSVKLSSHSTVSSAIIRLGDVANLNGLDAQSARAAADIALGRAPSVGVAKYIPRRFIESRIHQRLGHGVVVQGTRTTRGQAPRRDVEWRVSSTKGKGCDTDGHGFRSG